MTKTPEELTKDWKAGKLKEGDYYVQYADGDIRIEYASKWIHPNSPSNMVNFDDLISIYTVLAPVPSYEELIRLKRVEKKYQNIKANGNYPDKISQLKAKIKNLIEENKYAKHLLTSINAAIGESEE